MAHEFQIFEGYLWIVEFETRFSQNAFFETVNTITWKKF